MATSSNLGFERRLLQAAIAVVGLVPIVGGAAGIVFGASAFDPAATLNTSDAVAVDSHVRYLSGLLLAIGIAFYGLIATIERQTLLVRVLTGLVVTGGLARLYGVIVVGWPSGVMAFALAVELIVTPLLCLCQAGIARLSGN